MSDQVAQWALGELPVSSDGGEEFVERGCDALVRCGVDAEFVLAAAKVWRNAGPLMLTLAVHSRFKPRIGRSLAFRRP